MRNCTPIVQSAILSLLLVAGGWSIVHAKELRVRVNRWLQLQQFNGTVSLWQGNASRPARMGDRLQAVNDRISTGKQSAATLSIDLGIGQVILAEQTDLRLQTLEILPSQGRITRLQVSRGQARLKVRRFTNPDSRLELETPAGVTGVRGTDFGVSVQPAGKTGLVTQEGRVISSAQGRNIAVNAGFQNFTIPGEPPSPPVPISNDTQLRYHWVRQLDGGVRLLRLEAQVDPVNTVLINNVPQNTDRNGRFNVDIPATSFPRLRITVITPLGLQQEHEVALP